MFLIRYSIEIGLVTPPVRMLIAAVFGLLLIAAGEAARSRPSIAGDPRIAQALVGAGILVLYTTVYGSLTLYALIGLGAAAALMALITAAALIFSFRHGAPTAVMGLVDPGIGDGAGNRGHRLGDLLSFHIRALPREVLARAPVIERTGQGRRLPEGVTDTN